MSVIMLLVVSALAQDPNLAPTLADLDEGLARAERLLAEAEVEARRLGAAEAAWVSSGCVERACAEAVGVSLVVEVQAAGHRTRDLVQGTRAELGRLARLEVASTVAPLVDAGRRTRLDAVRAGTTAASRTYQVRVAWYQRWVAPWAAAHTPAVSAACAPATSAAP